MICNRMHRRKKRLSAEFARTEKDWSMRSRSWSREGDRSLEDPDRIDPDSTRGHAGCCVMPTLSAGHATDSYRPAPLVQPIP